MRFNLVITFADGTTKTIVASTADLVAFEDKFNLSIGRLASEQRLGHLLFLAWHSEQRRKETKLGYDEWLETVDSVGEAESSPK